MRVGFDPSGADDYETLYAWAFNVTLECSNLDDEQPSDVVMGGAIVEFRDLKRILDWALDKAHAEIGALAMARDSAETACPAPVPQDCQARGEANAQNTSQPPENPC